MGPSIEPLSPELIAENITALEYQSRYCPALVKNNVMTLCAKLNRDFPFGDKAAEERFEKGLTFCNIANERLGHEAQLANEKYASLTFDQYYDRYVKPLIPRNIKKLKERVIDNHLINCKISNLPVVSFRNPEVDAYLAAFEIAGPEICSGSSEKSDFNSYRHTLYLSLHRKG